jgi:hypothetical protein
MATLVTACAVPRKAKPSGPDYFAQLASIPDLPQHYKARALAIVMHQRKEAALQQLIAADEA